MTYQSIGVNNLEEWYAALDKGYFPTLPQAVDALLKAAAMAAPAPEPEPVVDEDAPPTRDEMMAKAAEINLTVDKRWSDKTLANKIIEALEAQEAELLTVPEDAPPAEPAS
jgi:hypothetical protein